jgi:1,4-dihydroxy-2-naphthoate octaprenyltransferase
MRTGTIPAMATSAPARPSSRLRNWAYVLRTTNPPPGRVDRISRWLVITRAAVLPMTITAALVAGILAWWLQPDEVSVGWWLLASAGIVLAHVANNLMNDQFDLEVGTDSERYPRALYAPHPVLSGMITRAGLLRATLVVNVVDLVILVVLFAARGWPVVAFALGGFLLSAAYTAPPLRLKKHGLGEPTVLLVWGPLMVGGTYYAATGHLPWEAVAASFPYALLCTTVLMGKHIDKIPWDAPDGTHTLPVLLGERNARVLTQVMTAGFYVLVLALVAVRAVPITSLLVVLALPRAARVWKAFGRPRPESPPDGWPIWPLWFAGLAFAHTRRAGALFVVGLALGLVAG